METRSAHEVAIDWALARGYNMSVTDLCDDPANWDVVHSYDRDAILEACRATDLPNVYIYNPMMQNGGRRTCHRHLLTFSVIDEGTPCETINDYTIPRHNTEWRLEAFKAFEAAIHYSNWEEPLKKYRVTLSATVVGTYYTEAKSEAEVVAFARNTAVAEWENCEYGEYKVEMIKQQ